MGLKNVAKKKESAATKAKGVIIEVTEDIEKEIEEWVESNRDKKDAAAKMEQCEAVILKVVEDKWHDACKKNGAVETSAKVGNIRISWKGKSQFVTSSSLGDGERAKSVFGDEYKKYFREVDEFQITPEAANNPEVSKKLEEALEKIQEEFPDVNIMTVKTKVVATDALYQDFVLNNNDEIEQKFAAAGIKRTKPTFAQR